ncbi:hypothetical protein QL285_093351 [Trifolium repens]|nr:hypothetical protein QL285_093351 [Trifolium repens]
MFGGRVLSQWLPKKITLVASDGVVGSYDINIYRILICNQVLGFVPIMQMVREDNIIISRSESSDFDNYEVINHTPNNNRIGKEFIIDGRTQQIEYNVVTRSKNVNNPTFSFLL